jgi:hypothetical protein
VHVLDSAYSISARLVSLDTLVTVLDSVKPFPDVQRRSDVDNRAEQFVVRAADSALVGDTIPLLLEVSFTDAGNSFTMQVEFEIMLGADTTGMEERAEGGGTRLKDEGGRMNQTIVRGVLRLPAAGMTNDQAPMTMLDATGHKVMELRPGENDVRGLAPGVYFVRGEGAKIPGSEGSSVRIVIAR